MAAKDYIVDISKSEVIFQGRTIATFHPEKRDEVNYLGDNKKRSRWIKAAIKAAPADFKVRPLSVEEDDGGVTWEEIESIALHERDFYESFPMAPRPFENPVTYKHEEVYRWFDKHYPEETSHLYPKGFWTREAAGLVGNATIRPLKVLQELERNPLKVN